MPAAAIGNIHVALDVDIGRISRFSDAANVIDRDTRRMRSALDGSSRSVATLQNQMNRNLRVRLFGDSLRTITRTNDEIQRLRASMVALSAITGTGLTSALSATFLLQTADRARLMSNQLRTVTKDTAELAAVQERLYDVAQRTRSSFQATTTIYARTERATEKLGLSQEKVLRLTETVQKAFAIGGATQAEAQGAAIQLSQGIASNRFSGEEFRSVAENAPVLLRGIADSLTGGDIGKLRQMAMQGQLTAKVVTEAIIEASARIDAEFNRTTATVGQSMTRLDNAFLMYVGQADSSLGITRRLAAAISGLADNFDELAGYAGKAMLAGGAIFAGRTASNAIGSAVESVSRRRKESRDAIDAILEETAAIEKRRAEIRLEQREIGRRARQQQTDLRFDQVGKQHAAREAEYEAQKRIRDIDAARLLVTDKLGIARSGVIASMQREVELARDDVRQAGYRVAAAQEAALAEERILQARRAQKLLSTDETVRQRGVDLGAAQARVADRAAAVQAASAQRAAQLRAEIQSRNVQLVSQAMGLRGVQSKIADLRSGSDLPDFEKVFGQEYRGLLKDQQTAMISTARLRGEIASLGKELAEVEAGASKAGGIGAAMKAHAQAVKEAEKATIALAAAEKARVAAAAQPVGGKTLDRRLAAEQEALRNYEKSIANLQQQMGALAQAKNGAFDTPALRKLGAEMKSLDQQMTEARGRLTAASRAVADSAGGDTATIAAAMAIRGKAIAEVNELQKEANELTKAATALTIRQAAAQRSANLLRAAGSSVLGFLGGWTGVAFIAAIAGMSMFAAHEMELAERTVQLKAEMKELGIVTDDAADGFGDLNKSIKELSLDQLRLKLARINQEMTLKKEGQNWFQRLFDYDPDNIDNIIREAGVLANLVAAAQNRRPTEQDVNAGEAITRIAKLAQEGLTPAKDLFDQLDAIGTENLSAPMLELIGRTREQVKYMQDLGLLAEKYNEQIKQAADNVGKGDRVGHGLFGFPQARDDFGLYRRMYPDKFGSVAEEAMEAAKKGMRDLIGFYEGTDKARGYNETLGFGAFTGGDVNLTSMTLREVLELQKRMLAHPDNTYGSSAVGRYQIVSSTLKDQIGKLGLSLDDYFSPELQDRIADNLMRQRGRSVSGLRSEWEGLKKAPDDQILNAFDVSATGMPAVDPSVQRWIDGLKELDLQKAVSGIDEFNQRVAQQAQALGATNEELIAYAKAVASGDMDKVPEKFRKIAEAMTAISENDAVREINLMDFTRLSAGLSDVQQKAIEAARSMGIAEPVIRQYMAALMAGEQVPPIMARIQDAVQHVTDQERMIQFTDGLAEAMGGIIMDFAHGEDALRNFALRISDLALQILVVEPLVESLKTGLRGLVSDAMSTSYTGGGGGGSLFGSLFGGIGKFLGSLFGFDEGGYTGPGAKKKPAGLVHAGEFVFNAKATRAAGIQNLNRLHRSLQHFDTGGYVSGLPSERWVGADWNARAPERKARAMNINISGARGNREIQDMVRIGVHAGLMEYDEALPGRIGEITERYG